MIDARRSSEPSLPPLVGRSLGPVRRLIEIAASTRRPTLITGETGTGKGLVARAVHAASDETPPLVSVNCAALPTTLLEAELFGVARGAFTDARQARPGLFEQAHGGSLLLDEIGELEATAQAKVLSAIETGVSRRVGDTVQRKSDARILAATNIDLETAMRAGSFRSDLYYRLAVFVIHLPPLRARSDDVPELVRHLLDEIGPAGELRLAPRELRRLTAYPWPGNVRELRNVLERAVLLHRASELRPSLFLGAARADAAGVPTDRPAVRDEALDLTLEEVGRRHIARVIADCDGNRTHAARRLGIGLSTLRRKLNQA